MDKNQSPTWSWWVCKYTGSRSQSLDGTRYPYCKCVWAKDIIDVWSKLIIDRNLVRIYLSDCKHDTDSVDESEEEEDDSEDYSDDSEGCFDDGFEYLRFIDRIKNDPTFAIDMTIKMFEWANGPHFILEQLPTGRG